MVWALKRRASHCVNEVGGSGRYHSPMAHATKLTKPEVERRRAAAKRMRGLFADVAPDRSLVDELIADRRAESQAEDHKSGARRQRRGG
jgi:hypothetical protein